MKTHHAIPMTVMLVLTWGFGSNSLADSPSFSRGDDISCAMYASSAVGQNEQNITHGCGFTGLKWSSNYDAHMSWCMWNDRSKPEPNPNQATKDREMELKNNCKGQIKSPAGEDAYCNQYAIRSANQAKEIARLGCKGKTPEYSGARWNENYEPHYSFCKKHGKIAASDAYDDRQNALNECNNCGSYARLSVEQYVRKENRGCNIQGGHWHNNEGQHLVWCLEQKAGANLNATKEKLKARQNALDHVCK